MNENEKKRLYATAEGMGFREIAQEMQKLGYSINTSLARLLMIKTLEKMVKELLKEYGEDKKFTKDYVHSIASDPDFQNVVAPFVMLAYM